MAGFKKYLLSLSCVLICSITLFIFMGKIGGVIGIGIGIAIADYLDQKKEK
ncbi:hypothetical protein ACEE78_05285 [Staphylococcus hyicus]|uniref:hypothetical protein n=1 Tax=Staphylococcus hyicus TaxID=1284 RepID=UPI00217D5FAF|nr:hypothetical protein [Staphylococcus hyicus]MDP4459902.1 hypothetical protein [Staphylococcus hyicus]UWF56012.1 hypothetical protein NZD48_08090 [Staphylococcus hyicus]